MDRLLRRVVVLAVVSAGSAGVLWLLVFGGGVGAGAGRTVGALLALALLLLPAAGTALAVRAVRALLALPGTVASEVRVAFQRGRLSGRSRLIGFIGVVWRLRALVVASRGVLFGLARLVKLPLVLGLIAAFLANFVVIAAAGLAVAVWLIRAVL